MPDSSDTLCTIWQFDLTAKQQNCFNAPNRGAIEVADSGTGMSDR
jgi:hypothetical protein